MLGWMGQALGKHLMGFAETITLETSNHKGNIISDPSPCWSLDALGNVYINI